MNDLIFIPIIQFPQLMMDNSKFFKEYSFVREQNIKLYDKAYDILPNGNAVIDVVIRPKNALWKKLKDRGLKPKFLLVKALIDTGANISGIRPGYLKYLNLKSFPGAEITGINKKSKIMRNVDLSVNIFNTFPDSGFLDICPAIVHFDSRMPYDFIIGWDILRYCEFSYNIPNNQFKLKFIEPVLAK